jgi:hypothetical protein
LRVFDTFAIVGVIVQGLESGLDVLAITTVLVFSSFRIHILMTHAADCFAVRPESVGEGGIDTNEADEKFHDAP